MSLITTFAKIFNNAINEAHVKKIALFIVTCIFVVSLYFYVSIYLFGRSFFMAAPIWIPPIISICLGILIFIMQMLKIESTSFFIESIAESDENSLVTKIFVSGIFSLINTAAWIGVLYIVNNIDAIRGCITFSRFVFIVIGVSLLYTILILSSPPNRQE